MELIPILAMSPVLIAAAYFDLRYMRIPNRLVAVGVLVFVLTGYFVSLPELGYRLVHAAIAFALGLLAFRMRWAGGGDVKLLAVLVSVVPTQSLAQFVFAFCLAGLLGVMFIVTLRRAPWLQNAGWITIERRGTFPLGISIAVAGLIHPFLVNFLSRHMVF